MKTALTIWLSFVLVWMQGGSLSAFPQADAPQVSATCPCHAKSCCYEAPASAPQSAPAATLNRTAQQESVQAVVTLLAARHVPVAVPTRESSPAVTSSTAPTVPLYQRNCVFLI